jgi:orotate phosphoribosyltransferase
MDSSSIISPRDTLLNLLVEHAYQYRPDNPFHLAAGGTSPEYLDCRQALSQPTALPAVGQVVYERLLNGAESVGGLTMGADPIAISTSCWSAGTVRPVRWFSVRKEQKTHGAKKLVEGSLSAGTKLAIVDDVATSGSSTITAISACKNAGYEVVQVIVLVDRESGGLEAIKAVLEPNIPVEAIFRKSEIRQHWKTKNQ